MGRVRKIPMRTCVGCRQVKPKKELVRVVRTPEGQVVLDSTGKRSGRGAYVCPDPGCFREALKARRLEKALEAVISPAVIEEMEGRLARLR